MLKKDGVVLVTTTFSKSLDDVRAQLALRTCQAARDNGYEIIVVDGSPCPEFKSAMRETGAIVIDQQKPGMGQSRRECFKAGLDSGAKVIVWLEPEKHTIVPLLEPCIQPVLAGHVSVVVPRRRNLDSYPQYQHFSELRANWSIGNVTGRSDLDLYIGPRVMNRWATELMMSYDGTIAGKTVGDNWEILFVPILWFIFRGVPVGSVIVDYVHPPEQLVEDDEIMRQKRDKQRIDLINAMQEEADRLGFKAL